MTLLTRGTLGELLMSDAMGDATTNERPGDPRTAAMLTEAQKARALGAVMGAATGDALGAPYEFEPPIAGSDDVAMVGGGHFNWKPGEWTDDTAMAIVVLRTAAEPALGGNLTSPDALDDIAAGWFRWSHETVDIGNLTSEVMLESHLVAQRRGDALPTGEDMHVAAREVMKSTPRSAGNGSLMRAFAVVLPYLRVSEEDFARAVTLVNALTHPDQEALEGVILWSFAIRHAILTGELDLLAGRHHLPAERLAFWEHALEEAASAPPAFFSRNGWVVHALQGAASAVLHAGDVPQEKFARRTYFARVVEQAVRAGYDTDTVASIAGALAGALVGYKAIEPAWRRALNGWPGLTGPDLLELGQRVLTQADAS